MTETANNTQRKRIYWLDNAKWFLILLVVLGHAIQHTYADFDQKWLFRAIYSFHMPAFMAVSGYLAYRAQAAKPHVSTYGKRLLRRVRQLVIPYIIWSLAAVWVINGSVTWADLTSLVTSPEQHLWFLWVLFWIFAFFETVKLAGARWPKYETVMVLGSVVMLYMLVALCHSQRFGLGSMKYYYIYYCLGYFAHRYPKIFTLPRPAVFTLFILWGMATYYWQLGPTAAWASDLHIASATLIYSLFKLVVATSAILVLLDVFSRYADKQYATTHLGQVTLGIYAIHQTVIALVSQGLSSLAPWLLVTLNFTMGLLASLLIIFILRKSRIGGFILLGENL